MPGFQIVFYLNGSFISSYLGQNKYSGTMELQNHSVVCCCMLNNTRVLLRVFIRDKLAYVQLITICQYSIAQTTHVLLRVYSRQVSICTGRN